MPSVNTRPALKLPMLALAAMLTLGSAANAALVVRSVGAGSFPVGRNVTAGTPIALPAGGMVTVLDGQATRTFRGPGTFDVGRAAAVTTTLAAASSVLDSRSIERKPRLGTVRGIPAIAAPSLFDVDLDAAGGTQCVVDPMNVTIRRSITTRQRSLTIKAEAGSETVTLTPGTAAAAWPKAMPAKGRFALSDSMRGDKTIDFAVIPAQTGDAATDAQALIKAGCTRQLDRFVAALETSEGK